MFFLFLFLFPLAHVQASADLSGTWFMVGERPQEKKISSFLLVIVFITTVRKDLSFLTGNFLIQLISL